MPEGTKLREDPISGMFNILHLDGRIVTTGKLGMNTSKHKAMLWRVATPDERSFLRAYVGHETNAPWPSGDTLLELAEVQDALIESDKKTRRLYRKYKKGKLFRTVLKDNGITWFMQNYTEEGRRKHDV